MGLLLNRQSRACHKPSHCRSQFVRRVTLQPLEERSMLSVVLGAALEDNIAEVAASTSAFVGTLDQQSRAAHDDEQVTSIRPDRVRASNAAGDSPLSATTSATTQGTVPATPTGLTAQATGPNSIFVDWNNSITVGDYFVERAPSLAGPYNQIAIVSASNTSSYTDAGSHIHPLRAYYYRVRAVEGGSSSPYSTAAIAYTSSSPAAKSDFAESWRNFVPASENPFATGSLYSSADDKAWLILSSSAIATATSGGLRIHIPDASNPNGTAMVAGYVGNEAFQNFVVDTSVTHTSPATASQFISGVFARGGAESFTGYALGISSNILLLGRIEAGGSSVTTLGLGIIPNYNPLATYGVKLVGFGGTLQGYALEGGLDGRILASVSVDDSLFTGPATVGVGMLTFDAVNGPIETVFGEFTAHELQAPPPSAPTGLVAQPSGMQSILLSWHPTISEGDYFLERSLSPNGPFTQFRILPFNQTSFLDSGPHLNPDTTYYYRVRATREGAPSPYSAIVSAKTLLDDGDLGDRISEASGLGNLSSGASVSRSAAIGDGPYANNDVDLFRFELPLPTQVIVDVNTPGSPLDAYLRLFNAAGVQIAANDDRAPGNVDPRITVTLSPGTYYVGVSGYPNMHYNPHVAGSGVASTTVGSYTLVVEVDSGMAAEWAPTITATAFYDGNSDPSVFGRYLVGPSVPDVLNTFTAHVTAPPGFTTTAVTFDSNFNGIRDAGDWSVMGSGPWSWEFNVSDLLADQTLRIWAQESGGQWSDPALFTIDVLPQPNWMDPAQTDVSFIAAAGGYEISSFIAERHLVDVAALLPDWLSRAVQLLGATNLDTGFAYGTQVDAFSRLNGTVRTDRIVPAIELWWLGEPMRLALPDEFRDRQSLETTVDVFRFFDVWSSGLGYFEIGDSTFYDGRISPMVTIKYASEHRLENDLQFSRFEQAFELQAELDAPFLHWDLPKIPAPVFGLPLVLKPFFGVAPFLSFKYVQTLKPDGKLGFDSFAGQAGISLDVGVAAEVDLVLVAGGVRAAGGIELAYQEQTMGGLISRSLPLLADITVSLVGDGLWGVFAGSIDIWSYVLLEIDLLQWISGDAVSGALAASNDFRLSSLIPGADGDVGAPIIVDADIARGAFAWTVARADGMPSPLFVERRVGGVWHPSEIVSVGDHFRGHAAVATLSGGEHVVIWSQSNLASNALSGLTPEQVVAEQELWFVTHDGETWSLPMQVTANGVADDSPAVAARSDGSVVAVWRRMNGSDIYDPALSDLVYALWDGAGWTSAAPLADTMEQLSHPAVTAMPNDDVVAVWLSDPAGDGSAVSVWSARFDGDAWALPVQISGAQLSSRNWLAIEVLADGRAIAVWTEEDLAGSRLVSAVCEASGDWSVPEAVVELPVVGKVDLATSGNVAHVVFHSFGLENEVYRVSRDYGDAAAREWSYVSLLTSGAGTAWWPSATTNELGELELRYVLDDTINSGQVAQRPDLTVFATSQILESVPPAVGEPSAVAVIIQNTGLAPSGATSVALFAGDPELGGILLATEMVPALAIGQSLSLGLPWTPVVGEHTLWIRVDPDNLVDEGIGEENNDEIVVVHVLVAPDVELDPASDTGIVGDNQTADMTPTLTGTAPSGSSVAVFLDSFTSAVAWASVVDGAYSVTLPPLNNGLHTIRVQALESAGFASPLSEPLALYIHATEVPAAVAPELEPADDSGLSGDGVTNVTRPRLIGAAKPAIAIAVYADDVLLGTTAAGTDGSYSFQPGSDLAAGAHAISVRQIDSVGNESPASQPLNLVIDATPPTVASVVVSSDSWSAALLDHLEAASLGVGGFAIPVGSGQQLNALPWSGLNRVAVGIDRKITSSFRGVHTSCARAV